MRRMIRLDPKDVWWYAARKAECYLPHEPTPMLSACSTPPIRMFACGICSRTEYSIHTLAPICSGGFAFSFTTVADE